MEINSSINWNQFMDIVRKFAYYPERFNRIALYDIETLENFARDLRNVNNKETDSKSVE